jgi:hypothetical protein
MEWVGHKELLRLSHILCRFLREGGIDVKSCPPLESGHLGQLRHDLKMPMVVLGIQFWEGGSVNNIVIGRIGEHPIHSPEGIGEDLSCRFVLGRVHVLETGMVGFGKDPGFEWKPGSKGGDGDERFIFGDNAVFLLKLLPNNIAEDTPVFIMEICLGSLNLFAHPLRDDGKSDDLRMGMFQRGPCCNAVVFEDKDMSETLVAPEIDDPLTVGQ